MNDDDLESGLRRVLTDPSRRLPDSLVRLDAVYAGARRRRARRNAVTAVAGAGLVVVAIAAVGAWHVVGGGAPAPSTAGGTTVATTPVVGNQSPSTSAPASPAPSNSASATPGAVSAPVPAGFSPVSVTAISPNHWWVLGNDGLVATTTDGGGSFSLVGDQHGPMPNLGAGAKQLRYANSADGWAISAGHAPDFSFFETTDGGDVWSAVRLDGDVTAVEAGGGNVFALTHRANGTWGLSVSVVDRDTWHSVTSLGTLTQPPLLAVQSGHAVIAAWNSAGFRVWLFQPSGAATSSTGPCTPDLGAGDLSATTGGVWIACHTGTADSIYRSDGGTAWSSVAVTTGSATRFKVGAIDGSTAAAGLQDGTIALVSDKGLTASSEGPWTGEVWNYLAFTNKSDGFALGGDGVLLRTTDGGHSWTEVGFS